MSGPKPDFPFAQAHRIDKACDRFEAVWQAGARPDLVAFLAEAPASDRVPLLLALLAVDAEYRRKQGELPSTADYIGRFPELHLDPVAVGRIVSGPSAETDHGSRTDGGSERVAIPGYEIIRELGRGGMGIVYLARDIKLGREVALKMVLGAARPESRELVRFLAEAEAVAAIDHPHVVRVYGYGDHEGQPYMALEYLDGGTLADRLRSAAPLKPRAAADLIAKLASAVQAAHDLGIVHRDLKPANVLFAGDEAGTRSSPARESTTPPVAQPALQVPKITDFGLAKRSGADLTQTGVIMGTPSYMAPEQARGDAKFVGPAADVWALGVILYECLTGTRPFAAPDVTVLLHWIRDMEPLGPRVLVPGIPRDLELICMKCLEKSPADRYPSAAGLAEELRRFTAGEPVSVRPAGLMERAYKWAKRKPTAAAAWAFALVAAVLGSSAGLALTLWQSAETERNNAVAARDDLTTANTAIEVARRQAESARQQAESARDRIADLNQQLDVSLKRTEQDRDENARLAKRLGAAKYARDVESAYRHAEKGNLDRARALLEACSKEQRGWEWHYIQRMCRPETLVLSDDSAAITAAYWSPDGTRVLTVSHERDRSRRLVTAEVQLWDPETGREVGRLPGGIELSAPAWSPRGTHVLYVADEQRVLIGDWLSGRVVASLKLPEGTAGVRSPAWSRTGERILAIVGRDVWIWDAVTGKRVGKLNGPESGVRSAVWSPDGSRVVMVAEDRTARVWSPGDGDRTVPLIAAAGEIAWAEWSPTGDRILGGADGRVGVWDPVSGERVRQFNGDSGGLSSPKWSPDGRRVLANSGKEAGIWDSETGSRVVTLKGCESEHWTQWSSDGTRILSRGGGGVGVWDAITGDALARLKDQGERPLRAEWSPDGTRVVTVARNGAYRLWDAVTGDEIQVIEPSPQQFPERAPNPVSWSPDSTRVLFVTAENVARVRNLVRARRQLVGHTDRIDAAGWSPDASQVMTVSGGQPATTPAKGSQVARVWNPVTGTTTRLLRGDDPLVAAWGVFRRAPVTGPGIVSPDGKLLADSPGNDQVVVRDAATGSIVTILRGNPAATEVDPRDLRNAGAISPDRLHELPATFNLGWSPDSRYVTLGAQGGVRGTTLRVWDVAAQREVQLWIEGAIPREPKPALVAWSRGHNRFATIFAERDMAIWDARTGYQVCRLEGPVAPVMWAAFSPDARRIVTASPGRAAQLWDVETGELLLTLAEGADAGRAVWSPDGDRLLIVHDREATILDPGTHVSPVVK